MVKGAAGLRFAGLVSKLSTENPAPTQSLRNFSASASFSNRCGSSAFTNSFPLPVENSAVILKAAAALNLFTSRSLSTIKRTATDCTRPADREGLIFFQSTGESSKPTNRSSTRLACCAYTRL
ncbi:hypothetical protein D3C86_1213450 [compost metagenome]